MASHFVNQARLTPSLSPWRWDIRRARRNHATRPRSTILDDPDHPVFTADSYDALNRLAITVANYHGTDAATANTTTAYAHDALDRLTGVSDPSGLNTVYDYDGLGDATGQSSPDTGSTARHFDAAGNVLSHTDAKGITASYTYDADDRVTGVSYPHASQNVAWHYDEPNSTTGCASSYPIGRLTRIVEAAITTVYCWQRGAEAAGFARFQCPVLCLAM